MVAVGEQKKTHILLNAEKERQDPIWNTDVLHYDRYKATIAAKPGPRTGSSRDNPFLIRSTTYARGFDIDGIFYLPAAAGGSPDS